MNANKWNEEIAKAISYANAQVTRYERIANGTTSTSIKAHNMKLAAQFSAHAKDLEMIQSQGYEYYNAKNN